MGRKPIGDKAMTTAERQRKRRTRLANEAKGQWVPEYRPSPRTLVDQHHNDFMDSLIDFLGYGDANAVTEFLVDVLSCRSTEENILQAIADRMAELEREAIAEAKEREALMERFVTGKMTGDDAVRYAMLFGDESLSR